MQHSLYISGKRIHSVKNGAVRILELALVRHHLDGPADKFSLAVTRIGIHDNDLIAVFPFSTQMLALTLLVIRYDTVGRIKYRLCRAVILFEFNDPGSREILLELQDKSYVSASERIDRLVVITDDAYISVA